MSEKKQKALSRREFLKAGVAASAALGLGGAARYTPKVTGRVRATQKMIVLGLDGLDPVLTRRWIDEGRLPAFAKLLRQGDFRPLGTSLPPQTPVAWSNFITGMDPGGHGIFDFFNRDPKTYVPVFSATETSGGTKTIRIGKTLIPLSGGHVRNLRKGQAFWQILEGAGIPSTIFKMPSNYPPVPTRQRTLAGMNTPDLKGSYGFFRYYTNEAQAVTQQAGGGGKVHDVFVVGNRVEAELPGPVNTFRTDAPEATIPFQVFIDPVNAAAKIAIQGQEFVLKEKEWSGWKHVHFDLMPTQSVHGICLFYLKEIRPKFKLYISPIHMDPARPPLPLSTPESYAKELERRFGPYFTKGLPADTSALDNNVLDEEEFLHLDNMVYEESMAMLEYELGRFGDGLLFFYFSNADQRQHMFWRLTDPGHPAYDEKLAAAFGDVIARTYAEMDRALDLALRKADRDTVVLVLSDHGFNTFRRGFNLNTWLFQQGYHRLQKPWKQAESSFFDNTDWSKTRAYGMGLNSLYIMRRAARAKAPSLRGRKRTTLSRRSPASLKP
jgi:predicted AlkP superfamily phosphohydrolase/phosphomutase